MDRTLKIKALPLLFSVLCLLVLASCQGKESLYKKSKLAMDTIVSVTVVSTSAKDSEASIDSSLAEIERLGKLMNFFSSDSELTLLNNSAGIKPVRVSKETFEVIEKAVYVSEKTGGAFDVSVGPVDSLWDFHTKVLPPQNAIKAKLPLVGYRNIVLDKANSTVFLKKKGMKLDLGGIVKGYAADKAVEVLKGRGIQSGIVAVGGEIKAFGRKPDGGLWKVGIKNPRQSGNDDEVFATIPLSDLAVSTAGDYEKFFIQDGTRYHHILDPKTGYPARGCRSVSVITKDGVFTDAFSTGIFVLGPEKGLETVKKLGLDAVIVDKDGEILTTDGLKGKLEIKGNRT